MVVKEARSQDTSSPPAASRGLYNVLMVLLLLSSSTEHLSGVSSFTPTTDGSSSNNNNNNYFHNALFVRKDQQQLHQQSSSYRRHSEFQLNMAVSSSIIRPIPATQTDETHKAANEVLEGLGIPFGLRQVVLSSLDTYQKRIWIVDNSGSMAMHDGSRILSPNGKDHQAATSSSTSCTRWAEVQETVNCHAMLAASINAPTDFRLLNPPSEGGPQSFRVGYGRHVLKDCKRVQSGLSRNSPSGQTPLASSIATIRNEVVAMLPQLEETGRKVAIVIATDGSNHSKDNVGSSVQEAERNQDLLAAIKSLQGLPVTIVLRLCTDYGPLIGFYTVLDECLSETRFGVDIDVIDDHESEAEEVHRQNPWLNYNLLLHRVREMGQEHVLFDVLDERPFSRLEIREFCTLLFGVQDWPDDWKEFLRAIQVIQELEKNHINPRTQKAEPWIDTGRLLAEYEWDADDDSNDSNGRR